MKKKSIKSSGSAIKEMAGLKMKGEIERVRSFCAKFGIQVPTDKQIKEMLTPICPPPLSEKQRREILDHARSVGLDLSGNSAPSVGRSFVSHWQICNTKPEPAAMDAALAMGWEPFQITKRAAWFKRRVGVSA